MQTLVEVHFTEADTERQGNRQTERKPKMEKQSQRESAETPIQIKQTEEEQTVTEMKPATRKADTTLHIRQLPSHLPSPLYTSRTPFGLRNTKVKCRHFHINFTAVTSLVNVCFKC